MNHEMLCWIDDIDDGWSVGGCCCVVNTTKIYQMTLLLDYYL